MKLLDMMYEQAFNERMAAAEAHGALVRMATDALDEKEYDAGFLAWLLTGSHEWPEPTAWDGYDADKDSCY